MWLFWEVTICNIVPIFSYWSWQNWQFLSRGKVFFTNYQHFHGFFASNTWFQTHVWSFSSHQDIGPSGDFNWEAIARLKRNCLFIGMNGNVTLSFLEKLFSDDTNFILHCLNFYGNSLWQPLIHSQTDILLYRVSSLTILVIRRNVM